MTVGSNYTEGNELIVHSLQVSAHFVGRDRRKFYQRNSVTCLYNKIIETIQSFNQNAIVNYITTIDQGREEIIMDSGPDCSQLFYDRYNDLLRFSRARFIFNVYFSIAVDSLDDLDWINDIISSWE